MNHQLPEQLLTSLEDIQGFDKKNFIDAHAKNQIITSIRFNHEKLMQHNAADIINSFNIENKIDWCEGAYYLKERPAFIFDPLLHAGVYYVQEPSSMFLYEVLQQTCNNDTAKKVLDLCAAPGGKSSLLASYFTDGLVISNEVIKQRANILYENLVKWGTVNTIITNNDAADFNKLENYFDVLLIDAPCSGSGLFRKDEDAVDEWSMENVNLCSQRQQRILADAYPSLKQNGVLIYSTCSYSKKENEDILDWIKNNFNVESIQLKIKDEWNITETHSSTHTAFGYRFWPDKIKGEGFFIAAFVKQDGEKNSFIRNKTLLAKTDNKQKEVASKFIKDDDWFFFNNDKNIHVINKKFSDDVALLQKKLYLKKAGVLLGEVIRDELIPNHELAVSTIINNSVNKIELNVEQALNFLRKKDVEINTNLKGWALSTYKNFNLGWMKLLHNRVNNYYPINWRILKS